MIDSLLSFNRARLNEEGLFGDFPRISSLFKELIVKTGKQKYLRWLHLSAKAALNLKFGRLSVKLEAAIDAILVIDFAILASHAESSIAVACDEVATTQELNEGVALRALFVGLFLQIWPIFAFIFLLNHLVFRTVILRMSFGFTYLTS